MRLGEQSAFQFIPKVFHEIEVRALNRPLESPPHRPWQTVSSWSSLCPQGYCHVGTCLAALVTMKGNWNTISYKDIDTMCASNFVSAFSGRPVYTCVDQVSTKCVCVMSVYLLNKSLCLSLQNSNKTIMTSINNGLFTFYYCLCYHAA